MFCWGFSWVFLGCFRISRVLPKFSGGFPRFSWVFLGVLVFLFSPRLFLWLQFSSGCLLGFIKGGQAKVFEGKADGFIHGCLGFAKEDLSTEK